MTRTILLTGAAGFIGSHLADELVSLGHKVIGVDDLSTGRLSNLKQLEKDNGFVFIQKKAEQVSEQDLSDGRVDVVVHLASPASPADFDRIPEDIIKVNTIGTYNLLKLADRHKARFVFASTSEVYGDPQVHPQPETYWGNVNPQGVRSVYDESKRLGETYASLYHRRNKLDVRIVRIFNTYGPRMRLDDGRVVTNFIKAILLGRPLPIYGDGSQTRSFCFVSDLVDGLLKLVMLDNLSGQTFNLGNDEEVSINQLVKAFEKILDRGLNKQYLPLPHSDDPKRRRPDLTKAVQLLGYKPKVSLTEGLTRTFNYFKSQS